VPGICEFEDLEFGVGMCSVGSESGVKEFSKGSTRWFVEDAFLSLAVVAFTGD